MMRLLPARVLRSGLLALGLALLTAAGAAAQDSGDGTVYSRYGLGELRSFSSSQIQALGGGGTALSTYNYVNLQNPATWANQVLTRFAGGVAYETLDARDALDNSSRLSSGALSAVSFSFPLMTDRLGVALAFAPYSRVNYEVPVEGLLLPDPGAARTDTTRYRIDYQGDGGLQQVLAGLGYRVNDYLSVGANAQFVFGMLEQEQETTFSGGGFGQTLLTSSTRLTGITGTAGARLTMPNLLREGDAFAVGAALTMPLSLDGTRVQTLGESLDRDTLGTAVDGDVRVPLRAQLGLAYQASSVVTLVADGQFEPWSQFDSDFVLAGFDPDGASGMSDRTRLSAGVEIVPAGNDVFASYIQRVAYRLGGYFEDGYVTPAAGTSIDAYALTGGVSLPTLVPGTRLDVNVEIGRRGTTDADLVRDTFYRVAVNVNIGERWFTQRKLR